MSLEPLIAEKFLPSSSFNLYFSFSQTALQPFVTILRVSISMFFFAFRAWHFSLLNKKTEAIWTRFSFCLDQPCYCSRMPRTGWFIKNSSGGLEIKRKTLAGYCVVKVWSLMASKRVPLTLCFRGEENSSPPKAEEMIYFFKAPFQSLPIPTYDVGALMA
jgi:hypothetical protein